MVLYTMKNLLPVKDILKTLPASGVNKYIKILQEQRSRKTAAKELGKMKKDKTNLKKVPPVLYLYNPIFVIKIFTNDKK